MLKKNTLRFWFSICLVFCFGFGTVAPAQFYSIQNYKSTEFLGNLSDSYSNHLSGSFEPAIWNAGLNKPETVSDRTAQSLFFLTISKFIDDGKEQFARDYIKLIGFVNCPDSQCSPNISEQDVEKILLAATKYQNKVAFLDSKALEFKRSNNSQQLSILQKQKIQELRKVIQKLSATLSPQTISQFQDHINFRIKPKVKIARNNSSKSNSTTTNQLRPIEDPPPDDTGLTTEMSDVWVAPSNESEEVLPEGTPLIFSSTVVGIGTSEADYDADVYQTSTTASIVSSGNTLSTNTATGTFSAVAETQYTREIDFGTVSLDEPETQYDVQSTHTYYTTPDSSSYYYSYTYFTFFISLRLTGYANPVPGFGGCAGSRPYGYGAYCFPLECSQYANYCGNGSTRGIQGIGIRVRYLFGGSVCYVRHFYVTFRPYCR